MVMTFNFDFYMSSWAKRRISYFTFIVLLWGVRLFARPYQQMVLRSLLSISVLA